MMSATSAKHSFAYAFTYRSYYFSYGYYNAQMNIAV